MTAHASTLRIRVDDRLKSQAADALAGAGLTLSEAVHILLTRAAVEDGLPAGLAVEPDAHDTWFRAKVREALDDPRPSIPHADVMADMRRMIEDKQRATS